MAAKDLKDEIIEPRPLIVGIGASAGGLEALQYFLESLPSSHNYAIVVIQHLDPDHESLLPELLSKRTKTPVHVASDLVEVEPGNIYLIAPGQSLTIREGALRTESFATPRGKRRPIDNFFESLAVNSGTSAVGIVLSGTGTDGTQGVRAIKEQGGLVLVQDPEESKYDGMPRSAIESGAHHLVLKVRDMTEVMNDYFNHLTGLEHDELTDGEFIERAMKHVRYRTGFDFSNYKPATLLRRIAVRMSVLGISRPQSYLKHLVGSPSEALNLFHDILINVTSFFRDTPAFELLRKEVIPKLVQNRGRDEEVRVWVPGCSTGQEAYSIAILISEELERLDVSPRISIFATDIDDNALRTARRGVYRNSIIDEVPEEYLHKYFSSRQDGYEVTQALRDKVRFSNQSLIKDPPFSRIDLISCRNLLIYFNNDLQDVAMQVFQYSLVDGGFLLLGSSERPGQITDFFEEISHRHRLYRRKAGVTARLDLSNLIPLQHAGRTRRAEKISDTATHAATILENFGPPHVIVNQLDELIFASNDAARFLTFKGGKPQLQLSKVIRPELEPAIRRLMSRTLSPDTTISIDFQGELEGETARLKISRRLLQGNDQIIVFKDQLLPLEMSETPIGSHSGSDTSDYVRELETELDGARQTIRTTVEELETSNEELKSSNEEMMSMNEELQSANEELTTTNEELNNKIAEVRYANADLANFIRSTRIPTVFLNRDMQLQRFTPEAQKIFRFVTNDEGRRLDDIGADIDVQRLIEMCREVVRTETIAEEEFSTFDGKRTFRVRVVPYEAEGRMTGGVVFTLVDIGDLRSLMAKAERQTEIASRARAELETIYAHSPMAMAMLGTDKKYLRVNEELAEINGISIEDTLGKQLADVVPELAEEVGGYVDQVLETRKEIVNIRVRGRTSKNLNDERIWECDYFPVELGEELLGVGINVRDITDQLRTEFELQRVMLELQHRVKNMLANVLALVSRASRDATADTAIFNALAKRIQALSQTHKLLTRSNWASARLHEIVEPELLRVYGSDRVKLHGPDVALNARAALSIGMAVHELATNAAKYGAFSNDEGVVTLSWVRQFDGEADRYIFTWTETGGPAPKNDAIDGFGSQLIRSTIEGSLDGKVEFRWEREGLVCVFAMATETLIEMDDDIAV